MVLNSLSFCLSVQLLSRPHPAQAPPTLLTSGSVCVLRLPGIAMLFISVLLSLPCWAVSFLSPETMAYSLESPVPRMSQGRPRGCWLGPRLCSSCCAYGFTRGIFLPFILFWWERPRVDHTIRQFPKEGESDLPGFPPGRRGFAAEIMDPPAVAAAPGDALRP